MNRVYIPQKKENKYHAKKVKEDGEVYASKKEHRRYCELKLLERAGKINSFSMGRDRDGRSLCQRTKDGTKKEKEKVC